MPDQPKSEARNAAKAYMPLFVEMITRADMVHGFIANPTNLPLQIVQEICVLQHRKICELWALGCLYLHHDLDGLKSLGNTWNADTIIGKLSHRYANFFPRTIAIESNSSKHNITFDVVEGALTGVELQLLYRFCGDQLHVGSLKNLSLAQRFPDAAPVVRWQQKIVALLNRHCVELSSGGWLIFTAKTQDGTPLCELLLNDAEGGIHIDTIRVNFASPERPPAT